MQTTLPKDVIVQVLYDRTELVDNVIRTVEENLLVGALLVIVVLFAFLGNLRAGLIVAAAIPLSMLFAVDLMLRAGIAASLLSLGAIDFGLIVNGAVVMVENAIRCLAERQRQLGRALTKQERERNADQRLAGSGAAGRVRRRHRPGGVPAHPQPGRHRRQTVPADGADDDLRPARLARSSP